MEGGPCCFVPSLRFGWTVARNEPDRIGQVGRIGVFSGGDIIEPVAAKQTWVAAQFIPAGNPYTRSWFLPQPFGGRSLAIQD